ncbi:ATP-dependent DNA helicase [Macrolepiota fuliginosa MF-IS2]|uniref:ATP-dependent DNA helicase n=1 Tax=Macrolepiota fuliginosa MF-IS2 TaxID=1400762 RepID=A0A9P6C4Z7_9AGAR|nr:ATP-dependent DNA helicase [Macrolepiota fuliginosa MF-IS2]
MTHQDSDDFSDALYQVFGHSTFKGKQKDIVQAAVAGQDVFVLAPTGMGKSLCFQLPAVMARSGITLVISPLCSLMINQVENLRKKGVGVVTLNAETDPKERQEIEMDLLSDHPQIRLLYMSPEKYVTPDCTRLLDAVHKKCNLNRLVIDEAHCISEWGHSFRGDYRRLGKFRDRYRDIPIMALTATATAIVQRDIIYSLNMDKDNLFYAVHPFNRDNLFYEVRYLSSPDSYARMQGVFEYITLLYQRRNRASSGIIYCRAKATCNELSTFLCGKGLNAKPYHRGISSGILKETLKKWTVGGNGEQGGVDLVVATIAFGLGIDKGDVRFEGYYQETGRAGRDGQPSKCILYYSREDAARVRDLVTKSDPNRKKDSFEGPSPTQRATSSTDELIQYAENVTSCRHVTICRYFGENIDDDVPDIAKRYCNAMCDVCKYPEKTKTRIRGLTPKSEFPRREPHNSRQVTSGANINVNARSEDHKRGYPDAGSSGPSRTAKKPKTCYVPPLATIPFESAKRLAKPFRPPFKKKAEDDPHETLQFNPHVSGDRESMAELGQPPEYENFDKVHVANRTTKSSAPGISAEPIAQVQFPDIEIELENSLSGKFPLTNRISGFNKIRRALHTISTDRLIDLPNLGSDIREQIFCDAAREAEFTAHSLSTTIDGYSIHIARIIRSVPHMMRMTEEEVRDEDVRDDARDMMDTLQRLCRAWRNKYGRE